MLIRIERSIFLPTATLGALYVNGRQLCATREDPFRGDGLFIPGESALPGGLYNLTPAAPSRRFGRDLPLIASTQPALERRRGPVRCGMFFHPGDPEPDLGGEILLGMTLDGVVLSRTAEAFSALLAAITDARSEKEAIDVEIN